MSTNKNGTVSSALLRDRDRIILEKHEKEKAELESKLQKMKQITDNTAKELFDAVHRGNRLARSLGFEDIYTAQVFIDASDCSVSYQDCLGRLKVLEAELSCEKKEAAVLQARLSKTEDNERLLEESRNSNRLQLEEIKDLKQRYDALKAVKERAAERYKADYKKWRDFCQWLFAENDQHRKHRNEPGISKEEKKRRDVDCIMRKRRKMIEIGPNLARFEEEPDDTENFPNISNPPPIGGIEPDEDKENDQLSSPSGKRKNELRSTGSSPLGPIRNVQPKSSANFNPPSSPNVFLTTPRVAPGHNTLRREPERTPHKRNRTTNEGRAHMPISSDTEDDSQAVFVPSTNPRSGSTAVFKVPAPPSAGRHQGESSGRVKGQPDFTGTGRSDHRPSKVRRISGDEFVGPLSVTNQDESTPSASKGKKNSEQKSAHDSHDLQRTKDYSAFKGRGRYGGQNQVIDQTINALYMIDPIMNAGKGHQFDEVVRSKEGRKKMHADDCECCREYYENIGPLPKRLQPPLWRSPSTSSSKSHRRHSDSWQNPSSSSKDDINAHRQAISRHRHTWARAKTPPGYWEIGFPTTQEVGDLNDKAREMQRKKMAEIESEVSKDAGRYRRKL